MRIVGDLKDSLTGLLSGIDLDTVTNLYGLLQKSSRTLAQQIDAPDSTGREQYMLFDGVFDYSAPDAIFGGAVNDLRPQGVSRSPIDTVNKQPIELFDRTKAYLSTGIQLTFEWNKGIPVMRVANSRVEGAVLVDNMTSMAGWSLSGTASGLALDDTVYYESPSALRFLLSGSGSGVLSKTLSNTLDMSTYEGVASFFLAVDVPDVSTLTSVTLKIGSSSTNYASVTQTTGFVGALQNNEYGLMQFDMANAVNTGTPDFENIAYVEITVNHTGTQTNFRIGKLFASLPFPYELLYQSTAIFLVDGSLSKEIEDDNDQIILGDSAYNIYEYQCALDIILAQGGSLSSGIGKEYKDILHNKDTGLYPKYRADNPSEELRTVDAYYEI